MSHRWTCFDILDALHLSRSYAQLCLQVVVLHPSVDDLITQVLLDLVLYFDKPLVNT